MSYIESHQELEGHFKTLDLMAELSIDLETAIGRLHRFWWWCVDYAETGYLTKHPAARLDAKFGRGFVAGMIKAGFIDKEQFRVHDWPDWAGRYLLTRHRTRRPLYVAGIYLAYGRRDDAAALLAQAVKMLRITQAQADQLFGDPNSSGQESMIEKGQTLERLPEKTLKIGPLETKRSDFSGKTGGQDPQTLGQGDNEKSGNSSQLNPTEPSTAQPTPSSSGGRASEADDNQLIAQPPNVAFDAWWSEYPVQAAKKLARKAWEKLHPDPALVDRMMRALKDQKAARTRLKAAHKFSPGWPNAAKYLSEDRWEDKVPEADGAAAAAVEGPPNGAKYSPETPLQRLVCIFKMIKGVAMEDRGWDESNWTGAEPSARHLLKAFDGDEMTAAVWLEAYGKEMDAGGMNKWTLKSAAERAWNTKGERVLAAPAAAGRPDGTASAGAVMLEQPDRHFISAAEER